MTGIGGDLAGALRQNARNVLELNRSMTNAESAKNFVDAPQNRFAFRMRHVLDQYVRAERMRVGTQTPDVQVMNVLHALDIAHRFGDATQFEAARQSLEKNIQRFTNNIPGRIRDQDAEREREQRIDIQPAGIADHNRTRNDCTGANRVAEHMNERGAQV